MLKLNTVFTGTELVRDQFEHSFLCLTCVLCLYSYSLNVSAIILFNITDSSANASYILQLPDQVLHSPLLLLLPNNNNKQTNYPPTTSNTLQSLSISAITIVTSNNFTSTIVKSITAELWTHRIQ